MEKIIGNTVDPWATQVWTVWVHLYMDFSPDILKIFLEVFNSLKKLEDEPHSLEILKKIKGMSWMRRMYIDTNLFYNLLQ